MDLSEAVYFSGAGFLEELSKSVYRFSQKGREDGSRSDQKRIVHTDVQGLEW
jgi:hypothetical protein